MINDYFQYVSVWLRPCDLSHMRHLTEFCKNSILKVISVQTFKQMHDLVEKWHFPQQILESRVFYFSVLLWLQLLDDEMKKHIFQNFSSF